MKALKLILISACALSLAACAGTARDPNYQYESYDTTGTGTTSGIYGTTTTSDPATSPPHSTMPPATSGVNSTNTPNTTANPGTTTPR